MVEEKGVVGGGRPAKHQQQKSIQPILGTASPRSQSPDDPKGELQEEVPGSSVCMVCSVGACVVIGSRAGIETSFVMFVSEGGGTAFEEPAVVGLTVSEEPASVVGCRTRGIGDETGDTSSVACQLQNDLMTRSTST